MVEIIHDIPDSIIVRLAADPTKEQRCAAKQRSSFLKSIERHAIEARIESRLPFKAPVKNAGLPMIVIKPQELTPVPKPKVRSLSPWRVDTNRIVKMREIVASCCQAMDALPEQMLGPSRRGAIVRKRQTAIYLCWKLTHSSLLQTGKFFERDHTTVLHAIWRINDCSKDPNFRSEIAQIEIALLGDES